MFWIINFHTIYNDAGNILFIILGLYSYSNHVRSGVNSISESNTILTLLSFVLSLLSSLKKKKRKHSFL